MAEVLPGNPLSAESLRSVHESGHDGIGEALTLRMASRSLVMYARTTLIATRRPSCIPCDTSAKPPHSTSTEFSEQSGMCMDVGITRCRLHVLQSLLSNFSRSRSDMASFSRHCNSYQPSVSALGMWKGSLYSFRQPGSGFRTPSFVETGRKRRPVEGPPWAAAVGWVVETRDT